MVPPPFISVIVPTFRRPGPLAKCLEALRDTIYPRDRLEVIVVDDGGEQSLTPVVASVADRLAIDVCWQPNAGPAAARNAGVARAQGELLAFTDDDCRPEPGWLPALAAAYRHDAEQLLGGPVVNVLADNPYATTSQFLSDLIFAYCNSDPRRATFLSSNNMAVSAAAFRALGGFHAGFRTAEDRELCDRWLFRGKRIAFVPEAVVRHAHELTFLHYCRQHFDYGRGASAFHRLRRARGSGDMRSALRFHGDVRRWLLPPFRRNRFGRASTIAGLLVVLQVANLLGYCSAQLGGRR
jgi:GT2 family glycosyltransferase